MPKSATDTTTTLKMIRVDDPKPEVPDGSSHPTPPPPNPPTVGPMQDGGRREAAGADRDSRRS